MNTTERLDADPGTARASPTIQSRSAVRRRPAVEDEPTRASRHRGDGKQSDIMRTSRKREGRHAKMAAFWAGLVIWLTVGVVAATTLGHAIGDPIAGWIIAMVALVIMAPFALPKNTSASSGRRRPDR